MKESEDDHNRDVQLVGFARNAIEDPKPPTDQRLANVQMDAEYWKNNDGYDNQAFHRTEPSSLERVNGLPSNGASYIPNNNNNNHNSGTNGHNNSSHNGSANGDNYTFAINDSNDDSESRSSWAEDTYRRCCSKKVLYKRIPVINTIRNYEKNMFVSDLVAGITVGLTIIPQAMAYASVAGVPVKYGLYSSFLASFIYVILGSLKDGSVAPTAIQAILIRENIHGLGPSFAILLCFWTGFVQLVMGALQLGFLVDFISGPVSVGFTSAAAISIAMTQVKDLLGLDFSASKFFDVWDQIAIHYKDIRTWDAVLGFTCMVVLLVLRKVKDIKVCPDDTKEKTACQRFLESFLWFLSTGRNILVVLVSGTIAYMFHEHGHGEPPFRLSAEVSPGLPSIEPPPFSAVVDNTTYDFFDMTSKLGSGIFIVPLLSLLEDISVGKVFSDGKPVDATQELLALGTCNLLSSFVGSIPLSGGLSRGAVNNASGARTTVGSIYSGLVVIISLQFFTSFLTYIPKASLAAVIIAAVVFMVEFHVVKPMWRTKKIDLVPAAATFLGCLLWRLEVGILIGVSINVLFLLYSSARPTVQVDKFKSEWGYEYVVITPDRSLAFPSVEYLRSVVSKAGVKQGNSSIPVVIDSRHVQGADFTAAKGIKSLIEDFVQRKQLLLFYNLKPSVVEIFKGVKPKDFHYCQTEKELHDFLKEYHFTNTSSIAKVKR